jgi:transcriptional regulator with XRE-family HTH domain
MVIAWLMNDFGKNLSVLRKERRLTQSGLADLLNIQPRLIGRWEQGKGKPQFDYIIKLADTLEVTIDRLLRGGDPTTTSEFDVHNRRLKELCKEVDKLSPEEQDVVCKFLAMAIRQGRMKSANSEII